MPESDNILIGVWGATDRAAGTDIDPNGWLHVGDGVPFSSQPYTEDDGCLMHTWPKGDIRQAFKDDAFFILSGSRGRLGRELPKKQPVKKRIDVDKLRGRKQLARKKLAKVNQLTLPPVELMGGAAKLREAMERVGLDSRDALALRDGFDLYEAIQERLMGRPIRPARGGSAMVAPYNPYPFTAANGTALAAIGDSAWTDHQAGMVVQSNRMNDPGTSEHISLATHSDIANVKVVGQVEIPVSPGNVGFLFRGMWSTDISGYYGVWPRNEHAIKIYRVTNGGFSLLSQNTGGAHSAGPHEMWFQASGTSLTGDIADSYPVSATDSTYSTGKTGFRNATANDSYCDDFEVWNLDASEGGVSYLDQGPFFQPKRINFG